MIEDSIDLNVSSPTMSSTIVTEDTIFSTHVSTPLAPLALTQFSNVVQSLPLPLRQTFQTKQDLTQFITNLPNMFPQWRDLVTKKPVFIDNNLSTDSASLGADPIKLLNPLNTLAPEAIGMHHRHLQRNMDPTSSIFCEETSQFIPLLVNSSVQSHSPPRPVVNPPEHPPDLEVLNSVEPLIPEVLSLVASSEPSGSSLFIPAPRVKDTPAINVSFPTPADGTTTPSEVIQKQEAPAQEIFEAAAKPAA